MRVISGGYMFVRGAPRPPYAESSVLPESIWTPTSCICELYPEYWAFSWCRPPQEEIDAALAHIGLASTDLCLLQDWVGHHC